MNWLNTLPDELIDNIYFINHEAYQKEINKLLNKPQVETCMDFYNLILYRRRYVLYRRDYIKHFVYHLENTF